MRVAGVSRPSTMIEPLPGAVLHEQIPMSRLVVLQTGHFASEESPVEYSTTILGAMRGP
jgi:hypothetical protein